MPTKTDAPTTAAALPPSLLLLMAIATGIAVASNYYAQPLLHTFTQYFHVSETAAGGIATIAQLFYALGLVFLVPLGDIIERKRLIITMMLFSTAGLVLCALATNCTLLVLGTALSCFFAVVVQVLVPYAATLAQPENRGRAVGTVMSGLLLGILLARTFSGIISTIGGWQLVYWAAAALMLAVTALLFIRLPAFPPSERIGYPRLIASIITLLTEFPLLRFRALLGGLVFANFSILWTSMAFMLASRYHFSNAIIGLFGLAGAAGTIAAPAAGKKSDTGHAASATRAGLITLLASWAFIYAAPSSIIMLIAGIIALDAAVQFVHIINMNEIFKLKPEARNRLNADYMGAYFIGGTIGSLASAFVYQNFEWTGIVVLGAIVALLALIIWETGTRKNASPIS